MREMSRQPLHEAGLGALTPCTIEHLRRTFDSQGAEVAQSVK